MATGNLSWNPCGSSSDGTYVYYGKKLIATGDPLSGTGWVLYTGNAVGPSVSIATIPGLDDNVEYIGYVYCHCATSGNGPLNSIGPVIKYVCATLGTISPTNNSINYTLQVPASANNSGTWITKIVVELLNSSGTTVLSTNTYNTPFNTSYNDLFNGLSPTTQYQLRVSYKNTSGSQTQQCATSTTSTNQNCVAPNPVTITNIFSNQFDVNWTNTGHTGDTYDVLINNSAVATGLFGSPFTVTGLAPSTSYTVTVRINCFSGGSATTTPVNGTTTGVNNLRIDQALAFLNVTGISGIAGFVYSPVSGTFQINTIRSAFTGPVSVNYTSNTPAFPPFSIQLKKNGVRVACFQLPAGINGSGTASFPSFTWNATDLLGIDIGTGSC